MENKNKKILLLGILSTLIAIGIHAYLTIQFFSLHFGLAGGFSACNINAFFNCDATSASSYSQFLNIPIALWGAVLNLILFLLLVISYTGLAERPARAHRAGLLLSLVSLVASLVMGSLSMLALGVVCLFCVATYILSLISFVCVFISAEKSKSWTDEIISYFKEDKWIAVMIIAIPVGAFIGNNMVRSAYEPKRLDSIIAEKTINWQQDKEINNFDLSQGLVLQKQENPTMTIVEFADYLCPHCKHAYPTLHAFTQSRKDVQLIFKSFPLDGTCNPDPQMTPGDGLRCKLSLATICLEKLEKKGWEANHFIFDHQEEFFKVSQPNEAMDKICSHFKETSCDNLKQCVDSPESLLELKKQAQEGISAKIRGTPAIFVNGKILSGGQVIPILESVYSTLKK